MYTESIVLSHATLPNVQLLCLAAHFTQAPSVATTLGPLGASRLTIAQLPHALKARDSPHAPAIAERRLRRLPPLGQPTRLRASMLVMLEEHAGEPR